MIEILSKTTATETFYLVVYPPNGHTFAAELLTIHELTGRVDNPEIPAPAFIHLVTPDGELTPVKITDVNHGEDDGGPYGGFEWEVEATDRSGHYVVEYILYVDETRAMVQEHEVRVTGFPAGSAPGEPEDWTAAG